MKYLLSLGISLLIFAAASEVVDARLLPRFTGSDSSTARVINTTSTDSIIVSPSFMPNKEGLIVSLANMQNAQSISYVLVYDTEGKSEGVTGTIDIDDQTETTREILFGTCSGAACRYHEKLDNIKLTVTSKLTDGKTSIKRYRIVL